MELRNSGENGELLFYVLNFNINSSTKYKNNNLFLRKARRSNDLNFNLISRFLSYTSFLQVRMGEHEKLFICWEKILNTTSLNER